MYNFFVSPARRRTICFQKCYTFEKVVRWSCSHFFCVARVGARGLRPGHRLARALAELGPTFIKFGQALSTRADLLGEQEAADLSQLQDRLPPFPFEQSKATVVTSS